MITEISGISGSRIAYYAAEYSRTHRKTLIVVSGSHITERLRDDISFFVPEKRIIILPEEEDTRILYEARDTKALSSKVNGLKSLVDEDDAIVIAPVSALLKPIESKKRFLDSFISLQVGMRKDPAELRKDLVNSGYEPSAVTESPAEYSARGGIVDVFPPDEDNPIRIEFFGDEIDSIRTFDKDTQRSLENMNNALVTPAALLVPTEEEINTALKIIEKEYGKDIDRIKKETGDDASDGRLKRISEMRDRLRTMFLEKTSKQIFANCIDFFDIEKNYLWDYLEDGDGTINIICDPARVVDSVPQFEDKDAFYDIYKKNCVVFTPFAERIKGISNPDKILNSRSHQVASFNGQMDVFAKEIETLVKGEYCITLVFSKEDRIEHIREFLDEKNIYGSINYATGDLGSGMVLDDRKICFITEQDIFPNIKKSTKKKKKKKSNTINFADLHKGDYVVHESHGIGKFEGIKTLKADGEIKDYLEIHYYGTDVLYIPTEQMDIIERYIGSEGNAPRLSKLSGGDWKRARESARKAIMTIAEDLVKLYAERERIGGYAFSEDSVWQGEFEDSFQYTETEDQLKAISEIKEDMEKPLPMDRLLCGDVGYGKTEVAARAIFKCLSEGKQAVLLAPTTLLANQHYHTLSERFEKYPFNIEMLSRFKTDKEQDEIIRKLKSGLVDFVIGTHRLLSSDVSYKDLGLLVIDEEQRFGVKHKEKIKMLRKNVDVLTLSATPIPRTLNMSLTGIKNISMIEEPPEDRYPVQTFVTTEDEDLIRTIIRRELARGGQTFIVRNRVKGINTLADKIRELVPEATVSVGHGQMDERNLENIMIDFVEGKTDVLVATTIIENGIDIPNANSIIILDADRLGMAQLYQLRGRVGRSIRMAYAYLMYKHELLLTEIAKKRLIAIREFTEFGAGFKLAMRDLEIRGAGNVLGEAQHGHISGIGYELYCKEIDRAVRKLSGEPVTEAKSEIAIEINVFGRIPSEYIEDEALKLQAYKRIAQIDSSDDADDVIEELIDRYGDIPDVTMQLIKISQIRSLAEKLGVETLTERGKRIVLSFGEVNTLEMYALVKTKEEYGETLTIMSAPRIGLSLYYGNNDKVNHLLQLMHKLEENRKASESLDSDS